MTFVQIIDFETERLGEMHQVLEEAGQRSGGRTGGPTHSMLLKDRDRPNSLVEFASSEEATRAGPLQGGGHLVLFAAYLELAVNP